MPEVGRVKACTECRQQKVKCDAYKDYSQPCSRCRSTHLPCIISRDFQRRPKKSKAQLQYELDRLRAQAGEQNAAHHRDDLNVQYEDDEQAERAPKRQRRATLSPARIGRSARPPAVHSDSSPSLREVLLPLSTPSTEAGASDAVDSLEEQHGDISDLILDDITVESHKLKDCYSRFFEHYAPHLPVSDPEISMAKRYRTSSLLFWAMICVGSRGYPKYPSLYAKLGPPVLQLAFKSLMSPPNPIPILQAVIIICNWPLPLDTIFKEPCQALAGAATSIAVQNGLHMYTREQDFLVKVYDKANGTVAEPVNDDPTRSRNHTRDEAVIARTRVWCHCLIVFQNTYVCDGLPPTGLTPCFRRSEVYGEIIKLLPELQGFRLRLHRLQIEAINVIASSCDIEQDKQDTVLNAMITTYDDRIRDIAMPRNDNFHLFIKTCVRVSVLGLIWLVQQEPSHYHALRLYKTAQEVISLAASLDLEIHDFTYHMPHFFMRMLLYSAHVVLRVHKSPLGEKLDINEGEKALGIVVPILKKRAAQAVDILAINAAVLQQLWTSKKAFVHGDGQPQNGIRVDVRYRLILNAVSDDVWWWRKEFASSPMLTEDLSVCNQKCVGGVDTQVDATETAPEASFEEEGMSFEHIFDDFQNWWSWSGMDMGGFEGNAGEMEQMGSGFR